MAKVGALAARGGNLAYEVVTWEGEGGFAHVNARAVLPWAKTMRDDVVTALAPLLLFVLPYPRPPCPVRPLCRGNLGRGVLTLTAEGRGGGREWLL